MHIFTMLAHLIHPSTHALVQDGGPTVKQCGAVVGALGGALFISCLWLLILSTVIVSATGFLEWLDALYIISYVKIVAITLQYAPQVGKKV